MTPELHSLVGELEANIAKVVLGKPRVVRLCVVALLAGEHVLLEDVPGVGKTLVGKALAKSINARFCRIQFTPDLLPGDIVGSSIFDAKTSEFFFSQGPIFANIVLADEINRTTPRTQSALLEAMSDGQVSVDGQTYRLPRPFMVIATQNPFEFEGTYPLPESQLDRFLLQTSIGYPERDEELQVLTSHRQGEPVDQLDAGARLPAGDRAARGRAPGDGGRGDSPLPARPDRRHAQQRRPARRREHARRAVPVSGQPGAGAGRRARLRRARRRQAVGRAGARRIA